MSKIVKVFIVDDATSIDEMTIRKVFPPNHYETKDVLDAACEYPELYNVHNGPLYEVGGKKYCINCIVNLNLNKRLGYQTYNH